MPSTGIETLLPEGWPRPKGYANGMRVGGERDLVFVAGQVGWDEHEKLVSGEFLPQLEQALRNVAAVIARAGGAPEDLVRLTIYVTDLADYRRDPEAVGAAWRRALGRVYPCVALLEVKGLLEPGARVEIEATAAVMRRA
jgi:enamine deaminase RidA (YjgF/YER057c/UK114 family)